MCMRRCCCIACGRNVWREYDEEIHIRGPESEGTKMKVWLRVVAGVALAALFVISAVQFRRPPDPVVHGKPASAWAADLLSPDYTVRGEAQNALQQLGESAVPQLRIL